MPGIKKDAPYHLKQWKIKAPLGLVLIGFGMCLVTEGVMMKYGDVAAWKWISWGTLALIVLNAGISVFGGAVVHRAHYERLSETEN
ncbi:MAG: hypothetical protein AAF696_00020 [Bacteroidota bacterium]